MEHLQKTIVGKFSTVDGFFVLAPLSPPTLQAIHRLQDQLAASLPKGSLWLPRNEQLHITFAHIVSPDETSIYDEDRASLFNKVRGRAVSALTQTIPSNLSIELKLECVNASPPAVFIRWTDDGTYDILRRKFTRLFQLPGATRRPPEIVHTSIARFYTPIDFADVQRAVQLLKIPALSERTTEFRLVHESKIYLEEHRVLATFPTRTA